MKENNMLIMAEQQILGFTEAMRGEDILSLCSAMGLTIDEWEELRPEVAIYMRSEDLSALDAYFLHLSIEE